MNRIAIAVGVAFLAMAPTAALAQSTQSAHPSLESWSDNNPYLEHDPTIVVDPLGQSPLTPYLADIVNPPTILLEATPEVLVPPAVAVEVLPRFAG